MILGMEIEIGLKTVHGFLNVENCESGRQVELENSKEDSFKCNKEYRSWFNKKEIVVISRNTNEGLVMKNPQGEICAVNENGILDVKEKEVANIDSFTFDDVRDYKVTIRNKGNGCYLSAHMSGLMTCDKLDPYLCEQFQVFINYNFFQKGKFFIFN